MNVDKYQINIDKNLTQLRDGIKVLEQQLSDEEQTGARYLYGRITGEHYLTSCCRDTKAEEDKLIQLQVKVDKLDALLGNQDDVTAR